MKYEATRDSKKSYQACLVHKNSEITRIFATSSEGLHIFDYFSGEVLNKVNSLYPAVFRLTTISNGYLIANSYLQTTLQLFRISDHSFYDSYETKSSCSDLKTIKHLNNEVVIIYDHLNEGTITFVPVNLPESEAELFETGRNFLEA